MKGERLGPYLIERGLGSGGMGKVYVAVVQGRAPGLEAGTRVALKIVHPHLLETEGFFKRFMREAQVGQAIVHDNVVRTLDCDAIAGSHFLVMEYVEGQTLAGLQRDLDRVPEELCRHIGREVCKGLAAIHAVGVVHRDLKPENVLITAEHVVKVMDLGVARLADEAIRLSQSGAFIGSAAYAAPEQFTSSEVDGRTDLHALGVLLYELACGHHPYRGGDFRAVMKRVCDEEPRRLGDVHQQLSPFFEEVVHTLLAKTRDERFATAEELHAVLAEGEDSAWWHERMRELRASSSQPPRRMRIQRETAVHGREDELSKLRSLYAAAQAGDGQVVLIRGEAGIGKTRLIDELIARLEQDGEDFNFLFGSYPPGGAATAADGFSRAYREHFGDAGSAEHLMQTPLLAPAFDAVLRGEPSPDGVFELTQDSLGTCFVHSTRSLGAERTTIVLIDDLQFAPKHARSMFTTLGLAMAGHRVLLVGSTRPAVSDEWVAHLRRREHTTLLDLTRLGPKDLISLLQDSLGSEQLALRLAGQVAQKSDGNPFFVFEIIRSLRDGSSLDGGAHGTWDSTQAIEDIRIPSSVLEMINARIAALEEEDKDLLEVAACYGFEFDPVLVATAAGIPVVPALKRLGRIEKSHRLVRAAGRHVTFDHHQVQEALYSGILEQLREHYHSALAEALETHASAAASDPTSLDGALCRDLCEHFLKGGRGERAKRYVAPAMAHLEQSYLQSQVVALAERVLSEPGLLAGTDRARVLLQLAGALDAMGRRTRQEEAVQEAERVAREAGDRAIQIEAALALSRRYWRTANHAAAEAASHRALEIAREVGDTRAEAGAIGQLGVVCWGTGRLTEAREHIERRLEICRDIDDRQGESVATGNLGLVVKAEGQLAEAKALYEHQLAIALEIGYRVSEVIAIGNLGNVLAAMGLLDAAREQHERHLALCRELGDRQGEARAMGSLGSVFWFEGRLAEAQVQFECQRDLCRETGDRRGEGSSTGNLGNVFFFSGRLEEARQQYERQIQLAHEIGDRRGEAYGRINRGSLAQALGDAALAKREMQAGLELSEASGLQQVVLSARLALASLHSAAGDEARAHKMYVVARDLAVEIRARGEETLARCHLARLPGGDAADALAAFEKNEEVLVADQRCEARLQLWLATRDKSHLVEAKRLLDESVARAPGESRERMLTELDVNRQIMDAWRAEIGDAGTGTATTVVRG